MAKSVTGWYAIINPFGHVSEVYNSLMHARGAVTSRGDGEQCKLVEIEVVFGREVAKMETAPKQARAPAKTARRRR